MSRKVAAIQLGRMGFQQAFQCQKYFERLHLEHRTGDRMVFDLLCEIIAFQLRYASTVHIHLGIFILTKVYNCCIPFSSQCYIRASP